MFISPLEYTISALTPLECVICKAEKFMLCTACAEQYIPSPDSRCYLCNTITTQHKVCRACRSKSALRRAWWLATYKSPYKELIYAMKYQRRRAFAREFGAHLEATLPYFSETTLVMPVPTASKRIRSRGYDQAVLIASEFARQRKLQLVQEIARTTQVDQIGRNRIERFKQMEGSLALKGKINIKSASILLIDDVLTTGATLEAAAKLLRQNGAAHVDAAVITRRLKS